MEDTQLQRIKQIKNLIKYHNKLVNTDLIPPVPVSQLKAGETYYIFDNMSTLGNSIYILPDQEINPDSYVKVKLDGDDFYGGMDENGYMDFKILSDGGFRQKCFTTMEDAKYYFYTYQLLQSINNYVISLSELINFVNNEQ